MSNKSRLVKIGLPLLILLLAVLASVLIVKSRKAPEKHAQMERGILVETLPVVRQTQQAIVHATGTVEAQREISLVAEVSGTLVWLSPRFVEGGFFRKGEKLLEIDPRDYRLALQRAQAGLAQARARLQTEENLSDIARREWDNIDLADKGEPSPLVLRQPQLESEKANLAAARADLEQARLSLERTVIRAPFSGRLRSKKVDLGEYVRAGNPLAVLAGTDQAEIIVPLAAEDLGWLKIPTAGSNQSGSQSIVSTLIGSTRHQWQGAVTRSFGEIDSINRMAKIVVTIDDPYNLGAGKNHGAFPLANGLFVDIEIKGASLEQVTAIPRSALHEGDVVWLADDNNGLEIRPVHVLRRQQQTLLIDQGLKGDEQLILTSISGAAPGMKLRPQNREKQP